MQLREIVIYPLKSGPAIRVSSAEIEGRGLKGDRRWLLVDAEGRAITRRTVPQLARLRIELLQPDASALYVSVEGQDGYEIDSSTYPSTQRLTVEVWNDKVSARHCNALDAWLQAQLSMKCHFVYLDAESRRAVASPFEAHDVSFADGYPLLVTQYASLHALEGETKQSLGMARFRSNLVVDGGPSLPAWAEHQWSSLHLGDVQLAAVSGCARCVMITQDPSSGRPQHPQLLKSLRQTNAEQELPRFGINCCVTKPGTVHVGMNVEAKTHCPDAS